MCQKVVESASGVVQEVYVCTAQERSELSSGAVAESRATERRPERFRRLLEGGVAALPLIHKVKKAKTVFLSLLKNNCR